MRAAVILMALLTFAGCAEIVKGAQPIFDRDVSCKGKATIQAGPYGGVFDCGDGFEFKAGPAK